MTLKQDSQNPAEYLSIEVAEATETTAVIEFPKFDSKNTIVNARLHGTVWKSLAFFFYGILGAFAFAFAGSGEVLFILAICFVFLNMYLAGPYIVMKVQGETLNDGTNLEDFLKEPFDTFTGRISGREAWLQICLIPSALFFTAVSIAIIFRLGFT